MPFLPNRFVAVQSNAELKIGSVLHALQVPLSGHLLSLNQIFLQSWNIRKNVTNRTHAKKILIQALLVAAVKSSAPTGKRVTPMLAIFFQGLIQTLSVLVIGPNWVGILVGAAFASVWTFVQQILIAWILFGSNFFEALFGLGIKLLQFFDISKQTAFTLLGAWVSLKIILGLLSASYALMLTPERAKNYFRQARKIRKKFNLKVRILSSDSPTIGALKDVLNPWFVVGFVISVGFYAWSETQSGAKNMQQISMDSFLYALRIFLGAWVLYLTVRILLERHKDSFHRKNP